MCMLMCRVGFVMSYFAYVIRLCVLKPCGAVAAPLLTIFSPPLVPTHWDFPVLKVRAVGLDLEGHRTISLVLPACGRERNAAERTTVR